MASASGTFCGVCETQYVVKEAVIWCPECDEGLCLSCEKHHQASKTSKNHEITSVKDYRQIPSSITSITQYCSDHEKRYQLYCSQHEKLCCPLCISRNHKTCELVAIDDIVKTSKTSALFDIMEQSLQDMKGNIGRIVEDRKLNMEKIQQQRQTFQTDIQKIRDKINKHLDKLENEIQQDIREAEKKVQSQIERLLSTFYDHEKSLDELQKNILATKSFATDLQTVLGGKMLEAEIQRKEMIMQSLIEDGSLQQIQLQCIIDDKISDILSIIKFGEISIIANPPTITLTMTRDKQAQQMVQTISKTINDINPTLFEIVKEGITSGITGCTVMPTGKMVFVDNDNNRLVIHNENGLIDFEIPVARRPVDVTCIDENTVAVTHHEWIYYIEIINIANKTIVKRIKTSNVCYGITNNNGKLIYYETGSGILTVDVNHESTITTVVKVDVKQHWNYVTAAKDKIYHTNPVTDTVTCYTVTGQKVWEKNEPILKIIRGIAIDNDSNLYVASKGRNNVVGLSPDGRHARELLGKEDGVDEPVGVYFDQGRKILLVSNHLCGTAFLYNI